MSYEDFWVENVVNYYDPDTGRITHVEMNGLREDGSPDSLIVKLHESVTFQARPAKSDPDVKDGS